MYQVIEMHGEWEPWWFTENWKEYIVKQESFENFEAALQAYTLEWNSLKEVYPSHKSHHNLLATFWNKKEKKWCEDCNEDLQLYHSILLLKDYQELPASDSFPDFEIQNDTPKQPTNCTLRSQ